MYFQIEKLLIKCNFITSLLAMVLISKNFGKQQLILWKFNSIWFIELKLEKVSILLVTDNEIMLNKRLKLHWNWKKNIINIKGFWGLLYYDSYILVSVSREIKVVERIVSKIYIREDEIIFEDKTSNHFSYLWPKLLNKIFTISLISMNCR